MTLTPLPIDEVIPELVAHVKVGRNVVLHAPTGAGKTTRVPVAVAAALPGRILVLEPRRIAARAAAARMAQEDGTELGGRIGYQVRQESRQSARTQILVVTEGILVRMLQDDPFLEGVDAVIFDEFHERSIHTDLGLALARQSQLQARPDLRLVVMSATLDSDQIARWLEGEVVRSSGRAYPVEQHWQSMDTGSRELPASVAAGVRRALESTDGHVLVFLPGLGEIRRTHEVLRRLVDPAIDIQELHGSMTLQEQQRAIAPGRARRVILATNVAETSLTVPGVTAVVDSGLERRLQYDLSRGVDQLHLVPISLAAAAQRSGRAGRERPGWALRLWHPSAEHRMEAQAPAEVHRIDLCESVLQIMAWGCSDPHTFQWFDAPSASRLEQARQTLRRIGFTDTSGGLTTLGRTLSSLPMHPRLARLVWECTQHGHAELGAMAAALLAGRDVVRTSRAGAPVAWRSSSDVWDRVQLLRGERGRFDSTEVNAPDLARVRDEAMQLVRQVSALAPRSVTGLDAEETLSRALASAWPDRICVAVADGDRGVTVDGVGVRPAPSTAVRDEKVWVAVEFEPVGQELRYSMAAALEPAWIPAHLRSEREEVSYDRAGQRVIARRVSRVGEVVVASVPIPLTDMEEAARVLVVHIRDDVSHALGLDDDGRRQKYERLEFLRRQQPDEAWPDPAGLTDMLVDGIRGCRSMADVRKRNVLAHLLQTLPWPLQQKFDRDAPAAMEVPSGSQIKIDYSDAEQPVLAVRIQEVFGWLETPRLADGTVPLTLHLLAPNYRPQQVTRDLRSFWQNTYAEVRRELRQRYPKHSWPDDPWTAQAVRGPIRRRPPSA